MRTHTSIGPVRQMILAHACIDNADSIHFNVLKKERCLFTFVDIKAHIVIAVAVVAAQLISIFYSSVSSSSTNTCRTFHIIYDALLHTVTQ